MKNKYRGSGETNDYLGSGSPSQGFPNGEDRLEVDGVQPRKKQGGRWSNRKIIIMSVVGALVLLLIGGGAYAYSIWNDPMAQFNNVADQITPRPEQTQAPGDTKIPSESGEPDPSPTIDPYELLLAQADTGFLKDIVNIMLIGVDYSVERSTWSGKKAFHSDVMIVLSVNKTTGAVNMISLPRDTYAKIPGVDGIYKLNASIDCGGGWPTTKDGSRSGFEKVCEAAEWMLGGIPVDYYYAVDMNAVKGLVDAIGGVQSFDVEMDFKMQGRTYKKGVQDMNGQAVLDYLRVRKGVSSAGDLNRINRQKKMLIAIFDKIKKNGLLTSIPSLLDAFDGNLYTNTTLAQTAALAAFGYNVDSSSIGMYSMGGKYNYGIFNWNFVLTDQKARVKLIEQIYGVKVDQYKDYTADAAETRWENMRAPVIKTQAEKALAKVKAKLDADAKLPVYVAPTPTPSPSKTPAPTVTPTPSAATPSPTPTETTSASTNEALRSFAAPDVRLMVSDASGTGSRNAALNTTTVIPPGYRQYLPDGPVWTLYNKAVSACAALGSQGSTAGKKAANDQVIADVRSLCATFSIPLPASYWRVNYESDKSFNEIYVDFN